MSGLTDHDLVERVCGGDRDAFAALYDRHSPVCYGMAMQIVRNASDAEEVMQDGWLYAWRNMRRYDPKRARIGTWLVMIVRSRALDRVRSLRARGQLENASLDGVSSNLGLAPDEQTFRHQLSRHIVDAMSALTPQQREALNLAFFEGLTHAQVAERLATPLGTVKSRIRDGLRILSSYLPKREWQ